MVNIGARLLEERKRLGLNQTDFSALGKAAKRAQVRYEAGERSPDLEYLAGIASAGADVLYIITGERRTSSSVSFQPLILRRALEVAEEELQAKPVRLTSTQKAEFITLLYEHFSSPEQDKKTIIDSFLLGVRPKSVDKSPPGGALRASAAMLSKSPKYKQLNKRIR